MTEQELYALIADHEADRVEFTVSTGDTDKFAEAVCAFANDLPNHRKPGHLLIGIRDRGQFGGIQVTDELLRNLAALRDSGNIQPLPAITVEKLVTPDGQVAVVTVQPALLPPFATGDAFVSAMDLGAATPRNRKSGDSSSAGSPMPRPSMPSPVWAANWETCRNPSS